MGKVSRDTLKNSQTPMKNKTADLVLLVDLQNCRVHFSESSTKTSIGLFTYLQIAIAVKYRIFSQYH